MNAQSIKRMLIATIVLTSTFLDCHEHNQCNKRVYEPAELITYQKTSINVHKRRKELSEQLALIDFKIRNLEQASKPDRGIAQLQKRINCLKRELNIDTEVDPHSLMGPIERSEYDQQQKKEQLSRKKYGIHASRIMQRKQKLTEKLNTINKKLAKKKIYRQRRCRS